jgi:hypothetical protein
MYRRPHFVSGPLTPQDAQALNELAEQVYRLSGAFAPSPPLVMTAGRIAWQHPNQLRDVTTDGFWARITGAPGGPNGTSYPWIEQLFDDNGQPSDMTGGRQGTATVLPAVPVPSVPANASLVVPVNAIVFLFLSQTKRAYNFAYC